MEHIRNACTQHFIQSTGSKCRRDVQSQAAELQAGWTDSVSFKGLQLLQVLNEYLLQSEKDPITWLDTSSDLINIYTCGQIKLSGGNFNTSIYIDNGTCANTCCTRAQRKTRPSKTGIPLMQHQCFLFSIFFSDIFFSPIRLDKSFFTF